MDVLFTATSVGYQRFTLVGGELKESPTLYPRSPRSEDMESAIEFGVQLLMDKDEEKDFFRLSYGEGIRLEDVVLISANELPKLAKRARIYK